MRRTGYPKGRKGYVVDYIVPLQCRGADVPSNMQWQTVQEAKIKDRSERNRRPSVLPSFFARRNTAVTRSLTNRILSQSIKRKSEANPKAYRRRFVLIGPTEPGQLARNQRFVGRASIRLRVV